MHRHGLLVEALGVGRGRGVAGGAGRGLGGAWALPGGGLGGLGAVDGGSGGQGRRQVEQVWVGGGQIEAAEAWVAIRFAYQSGVHMRAVAQV